MREIKLLSYDKKFPMSSVLRTPFEHQKHSNCFHYLYSKTINDLKLLWIILLNDLHFINQNIFTYLENSSANIWNIISLQIMLNEYINSLPFAVTIHQPTSCHSWGFTNRNLWPIIYYIFIWKETCISFTTSPGSQWSSLN